MTFPDLEEITNALEGRTLAKAAKVLRERGYPGVTVQWLKLTLNQADYTHLGHEYDKASTLVKTRNAQSTALTLRRENRVLTEALGTKDDFLNAVEQFASEMNSREPVNFREYIGVQAGTPMTVELLLSDLQIGKLAPGYNTLIARKRLFEYARAAMFQIEQKIALGYRIERIILALVGDIIESDKKHKNSARATDTGTAEQIYDAIEGLFEFVIEPLARLGVKVEVIGVTGNHDHDDHGINMFRPGREHLSYPLYRVLELLSSRAGYSNVSFNTPDGSYAVTDIYGQHVLYEHGVGVAVTEQAMKAHKIKRAEQEQKHITYFRMGDKHTVTSFNSGQMVVNGAFFGAKKGGMEYSGIAGFSSVAAQWMGFHVRRDDNRMTLYDCFTIQLDHVNE